jgi:aspartate kinase
LTAWAYRFLAQGDRAKVSVVGSAIQGLPGVVGRVMTALAEAKVTVWQSADSHSTVSLLVAESDVARAVKALHHQFGLEREPVAEPPTDPVSVADEDRGRV